jgi:hypothetical protein
MCSPIEKLKEAKDVPRARVAAAAEARHGVAFVRDVSCTSTGMG